MSVRRSLAAAVSSALLVAAAGGCGGEPREPAAADPPPSGAASPSPPEPTAREPWEVRSKAGAVAFVEHWVGLLSMALRSGETAELREASKRNCLSCNSISAGITEIYDSRSRIVTEGWRVVVAHPFKIQEQPPFDVAVRVMRAPEKVIRSDGKVEAFRGGEETYSAQVHWMRDRWVIARFDLVK